VNKCSAMTGNTTKEMPNTTYDMAICYTKLGLRGANRYGVLEDSDDEECMNN